MIGPNSHMLDYQLRAGLDNEYNITIFYNKLSAISGTNSADSAVMT